MFCERSYMAVRKKAQNWQEMLEIHTQKTYYLEYRKKKTTIEKQKNTTENEQKTQRDIYQRGYTDEEYTRREVQTFRHQEIQIKTTMRCHCMHN